MQRTEENERMATESTEELLKGTKKPSGGLKPIEVMHNNWDTARVYELCGWELLGVGMMEKPLYWQVPAPEILAVCRMLGIPRKKWKKITNDIKLIMQPVAKVYYNKGEVVI